MAIVGSIFGKEDTLLSLDGRYCFSIPPENIRKPLGFLTFSGSIEKLFMSNEKRSCIN